jgi:diaminopimelate decarboxylase
VHHFQYKDGILHAEDVNLAELAHDAGTPLYVYSTATLTRHVEVFRAAFRGRDIGIFYAMKANGNLSVVRTVAQAGAGADVVSEGEIRKALAAGVPADRIVFSGVGKTEDEIAFALTVGIHQLNVETAGELHLIDRVAQRLGVKAPVVFRVNPDVGAGGHAKITTGGDDNKFGISIPDTERLYAEARGLAGIAPLGLAVHIGSLIDDLAPFESAFLKMRALAERLVAAGHPVRRMDLGGGIGVSYAQEHGVAEGADFVEAYAAMVLRVMDGLDVHLAFEPGRMIVANAGILVTRVVATNQRPSRTFLVVDAGMNDLVRPAMYEAYHEIWPVRQPAPGTPTGPVDVVGPICESSDTFATARDLPPLAVGDLVALMSAGAYGASMSSTYNLRRLVPEVLVDGARAAVVRPRQTWDELIGLDRMAPWLTNR